MIVSIFANAISDDWILKTFPDLVQVYFVALSTVFTEALLNLPTGQRWEDQKPDISVEFFHDTNMKLEQLRVTLKYQFTQFESSTVMEKKILSFLLRPNAKIRWLGDNTP